MQRVVGPHMLKPSMLIGLTEWIGELCARGMPVLLPKSDVGVGYNSFALDVGDSEVGKPGYLRPTSVKSVKLGREVFGSPAAVCTLPMSSAG